MRLPATLVQLYPHRLFDGLIPGQHRLGKAAVAAVVTSVIISVLGCLFLGGRAFMGIAAILIIYMISKYRNFVLYLLLASLPVVSILIGGNVVFGYILMLLQLIIWMMAAKAPQKLGASAPRFIFYYAIVFVFFMTISAFNNGVTHEELLSVIRYVMNLFFLTAFYFFFDPRDTMKLFIAMTVPLLLSSYYMIASYVSSGSLIGFLALYRMKPAGIFTNANTFAFAIIAVVPFWLALGLWRRATRIGLISSVLSSYLLIVLFLTNSRAAFVGIFMVGLLYLIYSRKLKLLMAGSIVAVLLFYSVPHLRALAGIALRVERGASARGEVWSNSADLISKNWVLGVGVGNFREAYSSYYKTAHQRAFFGGTAHAHNLLLSKGVELGISGMLFVMLLYYLVIKTGFKTFHRMPSSEDRAVVMGIIGCMVALFGRSLFEASGVLDEGSLFPSFYFWIPFVALLKINSVGRVGLFADRASFSGED